MTVDQLQVCCKRFRDDICRYACTVPSMARMYRMWCSTDSTVQYCCRKSGINTLFPFVSGKKGPPRQREQTNPSAQSMYRYSSARVVDISRCRKANGLFLDVASVDPWHTKAKCRGHEFERQLHCITAGTREVSPASSDPSLCVLSRRTLGLWISVAFLTAYKLGRSHLSRVVIVKSRLFATGGWPIPTLRRLLRTISKPT